MYNIKFENYVPEPSVARSDRIVAAHYYAAWKYGAAGLHEALFHSRYQRLMRFAIMYEASPKWCGTDERDLLENLMPFWMENYIKRENYLVLDNKPVLFVYQQQRLGAECFPDAAVQKRVFDACREYAKQFGFEVSLSPSAILPPTERGMMI